MTQSDCAGHSGSITAADTDPNMHIDTLSHQSDSVGPPQADDSGISADPDTDQTNLRMEHDLGAGGLIQLICSPPNDAQPEVIHPAEAQVMNDTEALCTNEISNQVV